MDPIPPRLGYCCKWLTPDGDPAAERRMNLAGTTVTALARLDPPAALAKVTGIVAHNLEALASQIEDAARRQPLERLLRMISEILPAYTHPVARWMYRETDLRELVESGLARAGVLARAGGVRLSFHPGQYCVLATANVAAQRNAVEELEYHAAMLQMMGYSGWHPHGAHINVHAGGRAAGIEAFAAGFARLSEAARNLVTVENDEVSFGLEALLPLGDRLPIVLDLHHHWIASGGEYLEPDDARVAQVQESWRGLRPLAHISVSRRALMGEDHPVDQRPDFAALAARGLKMRDLRAHSTMMWNEAVNDWVARHLAWADFEVEAKGKNLASHDLAEDLLRRGRLSLPQGSLAPAEPGRRRAG